MAKVKLKTELKTQANRRGGYSTAIFKPTSKHI